MAELINPGKLAVEGNSYYQKQHFLEAAESFHAARVGYELAGELSAAAEMANNSSVAFLQAGQASRALEELAGIEEYYANSGDTRRQAIMAGNFASALDALERDGEAQSAYLRSADLLDRCGEDQLRANVMQSLSALQLRSGRKLEALVSMQQGIDGLKKPSIGQNLVKNLLQYPFQLFNKGR